MEVFTSLKDVTVSFPFWSQVITAALAWIGAWLMASFTSKNEALKQLREKRVQAYDEALEFLDEFRITPEIMFEDSFYIKSLRLSNHLRAYGSNNVVKKLSVMVETLHREKVQYQIAVKKLETKYVHVEVYDDEEGRQEREHYSISREELDNLIEREKEQRTPSGKQVLDLIRPVLAAIQHSVSKPKG